jgi:hypothetical protein
VVFVEIWWMDRWWKLNGKWEEKSFRVREFGEFLHASGASSSNSSLEFHGWRAGSVVVL